MPELTCFDIDEANHKGGGGHLIIWLYFIIELVILKCIYILATFNSQYSVNSDTSVACFGIGLSLPSIKTNQSVPFIFLTEGSEKLSSNGQLETTTQNIKNHSNVTSTSFSSQCLVLTQTNLVESISNRQSSIESKPQGWLVLRLPHLI